MLTVLRSNAGNHVARRQKLSVKASQKSNQLYSRVTISVLPDDVLLEIFVYAIRQHRTRLWNPDGPLAQPLEDSWRPLVHVCKRWRCVLFSSPHRLDLRLSCTNRTPVKKLLDIWPPFPIYVYALHRELMSPLQGVTNLMTALKKRNRVFGIYIYGVPISLLKSIVAMKSFPSLAELTLRSYDEIAPVLPDSFLGGTAPRLRSFYLYGISFPGLGKLLVSTADLVRLSLFNIPHSGYISPEAIAANLSMLTKLEVLTLRFGFPRSRALRENRKSPPLIRDVLPALYWLDFKGDSEYLEDIVARVDVPLLRRVDISFFNQLVFDTPQLCRLISHSNIFEAPARASIFFQNSDVYIEFFGLRLSWSILCKPSDWQLSSLAQLYTSALSPPPTLEYLKIWDHRGYSSWEDDTENIQWLELLLPFTAVKELVLSGLSNNLFERMLPALDELVGESVTEMLPALRSLSLEGQRPSEVVRKAIGNSRFIATRQLLGYPVTIQYQDDKDEDENKNKNDAESDDEDLDDEDEDDGDSVYEYAR